MDEDRIGLVLARASELRLKITNCIQQASIDSAKKDAEKSSENEDSGLDPEAEEDEDEETDSLLNIRDALEALEAQLSSLQALQQQQWYEKEAALAEIESSQKKLFKKLREYKGKDLEVIHEAAAFVGESVDDNNDLLLPPYPSWPSHLLGSDNGYLSHFTSTNKYPQNGMISNGSKGEFTKVISNTRRNQMSPNSKSPFNGIKALIGAAAKAAFTVAGVICVLSLAGFEPRFRKRDNQLNILGLFQQRENGDKGTTVQCPPGRIPVMQAGEIRCLVKERVEIPFESAIATPDVNYGCG